MYRVTFGLNYLPMAPYFYYSHGTVWQLAEIGEARVGHLPISSSVRAQAPLKASEGSFEGVCAQIGIP